jgi:hypothetical protein
MTGDFFAMGDDDFYAIPENITTVVDVSFLADDRRKPCVEISWSASGRWRSEQRQYYLGLLPGKYAVSWT